jgi:hypothetical protein
MEMKKQVGKITMDLNKIIIIVCSILMITSIIISILLYHYNKEMAFISDMFSSGFLAIIIGQFVELWIKKRMENDISCEYLNISCKYQNHLSKAGIVQVYDKRKNTKADGYYYDLLEDFNNLNKEHNSSDNPIKMIGVSLDAFFEDTSSTKDLPGVVAGLCSSAYFQVMLCTLENSELITRLDFVNKKLNKQIKIDDTPIIKEIKESTSCIKELQKNNNERLKCKQYGFSPYATIIIINEHIYYTPNVLDYLSYLPVGEQELRERYEKYNNAELSLCIKKDSKYGERLVHLFDSLWENGLSQLL